ncbi:glycosyltransferase family 2 protein [Labrys neptuniae]
MSAQDNAPEISVIVPVRNEAGNVEPLIREIAAALSGRRFEIVYVDDGSSDATPAELTRLKAELPFLRSLRHEASCGQSCAVRTGIRHAHGSLMVTIDGDGQNNPVYIPALVDALVSGGAEVGMIAGQRLGRKDTGFKRWQSRIANKVRASVLKDGTRDTGCGLKAIRREVYLALPYFDALHRFMPALVKREGFEVGHVDVVDRSRLTGVSNYGFFDRLWVGILDLAGVWWLIRRRKRVPVVSRGGQDAR